MKKVKNISSDFLFVSKYIEVLGSKMHYIDEGEGDPFLFLHSFPVSNYIWRNVIPTLQDLGRCIAPDMIGMGKSDMPENITYDVQTQCEYINAFIKALDLKNITLVLHGFGSLMGLYYAMLHNDNIKAIVLYEVHLSTHRAQSQILSLPVKHLLSFVTKDPATSYKAVVENNFLLKRMLRHSLLEKSNSYDVLGHYEKPFENKSHRRVLWETVQDFVKIENKSSDIYKLIDRYSRYLQTSDVPKLLLYDVPGFNTTIETVQWARDNMPNIEVVELGEGYYFAQESDPLKFAEALKKWYLAIK